MPSLSRKDFLKKSLTATAAVSLLPQACGLLDEPEMRVCSVSEAEKAPFIQATFNGDQIFLTPQDEGWVIFSLVCRHKRCTVKWKAAETLFACPCHEGTYDAQGRVLSGPPPGPLRRFKYEIREHDIWVLNQYVSS